MRSLVRRESFWAVVAAEDGVEDEAVVGGLTAHVLPMTRSRSTELFLYDLAVGADRQRRGIDRGLVTEVLSLARASRFNLLAHPGWLPSERTCHDGNVPILPKERDPRLITIRRGGTLTDEHHRLLADWALVCAEHVLHLFEERQPTDLRPREAIAIGRAWIRGEVRMRDAHQAAFRANAAARGMPDAAKLAALSAGQAVAVAHVAAHDLGAAAYAIRAAGACVPADEAPRARAREREWQRARLPAAIRALVLEDQERRSALCWHVFDD